jgi:restriction endonuclease S subunit
MKFTTDKLGNLTTNLDKRRIPLNSKQRAAKKEIGLYPYYGANNILDYIDEFIFDEKILCIAEDGGSWGAQERCAYIVNEKCWVNNHAHVIRENGKANLEYLYFYLNYANLNKHITGTTRGKLTRRELEKIEIPLPPTLDDQKRIAKILSDCEALIQKRKDSIELLDELLKSTFLEMFGDPVRNEKGWDMVVLSKFGTIDRGVSKHRPRNAPELLNGEYPLIQTGDVSNSGTYIKSYKQTYSVLGLKQSKMWPSGTLCITIAANIAKTGILSFDACFPDSIVGFVVDPKEATNLYVHHLFSFFQRILEKNAPSAAQKNINLNILRNFKVPQPPLELQQAFDDIVTKVEGIKNQFEASLQELENLYGSISQRAFKGELELDKVDISDMEESKKKVETEVEDEKVMSEEEYSKLKTQIDEIISSEIEDESYLTENVLSYIDHSKELRSVIFKQKKNKNLDLESFKDSLSKINSLGEKITNEVKEFTPWQIDQHRAIERYIPLLTESILEEFPNINQFSRNQFEYGSMSLDDYYGIPGEIIAQFGSIESTTLDLDFFFKKYFSNQFFTIKEVQDTYDKVVYEQGDWFKYEDVKDYVFKSLEGDDALLTQEFVIKKIMNPDTGKGEFLNQVMLKILP